MLAIESGLSPGESDAADIANPIDIPESVVIALTVVLGIGLLYLLSRQRFSFRFRRPSINLTRSAAAEITEEEQAEQIADFARDLIDELNDGDSPRYAIQRAYCGGRDRLRSYRAHPQTRPRPPCVTSTGSSAATPA